MIEAKKILKLIRYKLGDNNEIEFSDYDIKNALNEALRYIVQEQTMQNSDFLEVSNLFDEVEMNKELLEAKESEEPAEETELYDFRLKGLDLPEDFSTIAGVTDVYGRDLRPCDSTKIPRRMEYKVMGEKIYVGVPVFVLTYKRVLDEVKSFDEDIIELPLFCTDLIVKVACMILRQAETDIMLDVIEKTATALIPRRRYNNAEMKMPFYC